MIEMLRLRKEGSVRLLEGLAETEAGCALSFEVRELATSLLD